MPDIEDVLALSPLQEGLYSLAALAGADDLYTMRFDVDIEGQVDVGRLRDGVATLLARHSNLRASFWDKDLPRPVQIVPRSVELPWHGTELLDAPFDLARGPLLRVVLGEGRLTVVAHHILMDGWSLGVFFRELFELYNGGTLPPPRRYRDYIGWLAARDTDAGLRAWVEHLGDVDPLIVADRSAAGVNTVAPQLFKLTMPAAETDRLAGWARANGLTMNTVVQFAWTLLLARLTDRTDIVFGTTVTGRPDDLAGVERMIGLFINTIPVRAELTGEPIAVQAARLQRESAAMREHGYLGLSAIQRAAGHGTLFDTLFVFENAPVADVLQPFTTRDGVTFTPVESASLSHYPLAVVAYVLAGELTVVVEAVPDLLPHVAIDELGERLTAVLRQLPDAAGIDAVDVLLPHEHPAKPAPAVDATIPDLFAAQVAATPDALALAAGDERYTYRELADAVAAKARSLGEVGAEDVVSIAIPRSAESIITILAVLSTGAAYVPIDITLPQARIDAILQQAVRDSHPLAAKNHARALNSAYVIFTSGSTGEPKGVVGTHGAIASYFADHRDRVYRPAVERLGRKLRIAHAWSLSFDASWQPLIGLLDGHSIHLFDPNDRLADLLVEHRIDMVDTTPSMYAQIRDQVSLPVLALGGEAISAPLWNQLAALPDTAVYNCYGPTETTVEAVVARVEGPLPTIGRPVAGMTGYILDSQLRVVPGGALGELYLSGAQVARGYIGRPGRTAERFVADPHRAGERMYRTGDLVRRQPGGTIGYLGRADDQVKIRGYRVELGEIETALLRLPGVHTAATVVIRRGGGASIVAFVTGAPVDPAQVRDVLPAYMIPARIMTVDELPVTTNGKLDTARLTALAIETLGSGGDATPRTATEQALCNAVAAITGGETPPTDTDLIALGLDSIVAIALVNHLRRTGLPVTPRDVLAAPNLRELAAAIDSAPVQPRSSAPAEFGPVGDVPILSWMTEHGNYRRLALTTLIRLPDDVDTDSLTTVLQILLDSHDMLRAVLDDDGLRTRPPGSVAAGAILRTSDGDPETESRAAIDEIDPAAGELVRAVRLTRDNVLLLVIHHLAVDPVSWHIILGDLAHHWRQLRAGNDPKPSVEFTGYRKWAELTRARSGTAAVAAQRDYWIEQVTGPDPVLGSRRPDPRTDTWDSYRLTPVVTPLPDGADPRTFLLAVLTTTFGMWRAERDQDPRAGVLVAVEGHGREDAVLGTGVDTAQTVGWFTSVAPLRLGADIDHRDAAAVLRSTATALAQMPNNGVDFGVLRYLDGAAELTTEPQVLFDYLGRMDIPEGPWTPVADLDMIARLPIATEPDFPLRYALDVIAGVSNGQATVLLRWSDAIFTAADADRLALLWSAAAALLLEDFRKDSSR